MPNFYNPYQFVPVERPNDAQKRASCTREEFPDPEKRPKHVTHERYVPGKHSGRLVVRLRTVTPVVVGGEQIRKEKDFTEVKPYRAGGRVAIPGSSIRGLTSSVIEAATDGPLRVLTDRALSYRKPMAKPLSAIGMLQMEKGELRLLPLCLPVLESKDGGKSFVAPRGYRDVFPKPQLKVFLEGPAEIRSEKLTFRTAQSPQEYAALPVKQLEWQGNAVVDTSLVVKKKMYAIAQDWDRDPKAKARLGLYRVLGCWGDRKEDIPPGKKHELWVPLPPPGAVRTLPIQQNAIDRFHELADERTAADPRLPF